MNRKQWIIAIVAGVIVLSVIIYFLFIYKTSSGETILGNNPPHDFGFSGSGGDLDPPSGIGRFTNWVNNLFN